MTNRHPHRLAVAATVLIGVTGGGVAVAEAATHAPRPSARVSLTTAPRTARLDNPVAAAIRHALVRGGVEGVLAGTVRVDAFTAADASNLTAVATVNTADLKKEQAKVAAASATTSVARDERAAYAHATSTGLAAQTKLLAAARAFKAGQTSVARDDLQAFNTADVKALSLMTSLGKSVGAKR